MAQLRNAYYGGGMAGDPVLGSAIGSLFPNINDPLTGLPMNTGYSGGLSGQLGITESDSPAESGVPPVAPPPPGGFDPNDVETGTSQGPRERSGVVLRSPSAGSITPPSMESQVGARMAPAMPRSPTPQAGMGSMATGAGAFPAPSPFQLNERPGQGLYSKAGGLLGGGTSVLGAGEKGEELPSELLALLALLGGQQ